MLGGGSGLGGLGLGHFGAIGDNESPSSIGFVDVGADVEQLAVGNYHTCVLLADRSVKCWGYNVDGQLGLGHRNNIGDNELPSTLSPLSLGESIRQVAAGNNFTCALTESGKVKCWGDNIHGQLGLSHTNDIGDDASETSSTFTAINLGSRAMKISLGDSYACALLKEGRVRCWGYNGSGQLGLWSYP